jgi:5'-deoxynucleotidase YfbR-like HD superfamily hydrolase
MNLVSELLAELSTFPGREEGLRKVDRWHINRPMFYRPNLFSHSKKVAWLVSEILPFAERILGNTFDSKRALAIALVHDDAELVTGDYQAGDKANMTKEQLAALDREEREAIETLATRFPKTIGGYNYRELLLDILDMTTPEARVAKYLDRFDGFGEGLHEVYAGNTRFTVPTKTEYGMAPQFYTLNVSLREKMMEKYPELEKTKNKHLFFEFPRDIDCGEVVKGRIPYTQTSLTEPVEFPQYDEWKKVILASGDSEEIKNLYTQREFA